MKELLFAGSGGQGVLTSALIISDIAASKDMKVTWVPSYGSSMRGGTANCTVKYSADEEIYNPSPENPDLLLAMNQPSFNKFLPKVISGGTVIIGDLVEISEHDRKDVNYIRINCSNISNNIGDTKVANIVMVGAIIKLMSDFTHDEAINAMNKMFEKKGKNKFIEINSKAFNAGYEAVSL